MMRGAGNADSQHRFGAPDELDGKTPRIAEHHQHVTGGSGGEIILDRCPRGNEPVAIERRFIQQKATCSNKESMFL